MARLRRALLALGVVSLLAAGTAGAARADGDPASDVLAQTPPVFIPPGQGIGYAQEAAVAAQLRAAAQRGHSLRVAVIPDRIALGSIGALWHRPAEYAAFLGSELSLGYHGELLVVMPNGFGVSRDGRALSTSLDRLAPRPGQLLLATEQAITRLTGSGARSTAMVAAAPSRTSGLGWWIGVAAAAAVTAAAWALSLRARPVRRRPAASQPS